jgi:hypothetical protein
MLASQPGGYRPLCSPGQNGGHRQRSPAPRRGNPRSAGAGGNNGRRPGTRRPVNDRRGRDDRGRPLVQGRPQKTTEELDAEMEDYWTKYNTEGNAAATNGETVTEALPMRHRMEITQSTRMTSIST